MAPPFPNSRPHPPSLRNVSLSAGKVTVQADDKVIGAAGKPAKEITMATAGRAGHISEHDLERYYLGMISDLHELTVLEEHLLACPVCVQWAAASDDYIACLRAAIIEGGFDRPAA